MEVMDEYVEVLCVGGEAAGSSMRVHNQAKVFQVPLRSPLTGHVDSRQADTAVPTPYVRCAIYVVIDIHAGGTVIKFGVPHGYNAVWGLKELLTLYERTEGGGV